MENLFSKFPNKHDGFLEVTKAIWNAVEDLCGPVEQNEASIPGNTITKEKFKGARPRSSNLRVKKDFTHRDKDRFLTDAFEYVAKYFEGSLRELEERNPGIETNYTYRRKPLHGVGLPTWQRVESV
jgi:hypothetical protein